MQKAAAERLDTLLPKTEEIENVGKMSAEGEGVECRPYRSRSLSWKQQGANLQFIVACQVSLLYWDWATILNKHLLGEGANCYLYAHKKSLTNIGQGTKFYI